ncbi:hypothetical protein AciM339_1198 [Aciduliprofundum sp. MAR08-339]|uniref:DUF357 domain-containing protein n=1 Tax=Aciduliprofundum sp. (strain MAR08-339) TaxID=673860 RepID=UPI0002A481D7|nr:hypothetical protein AciM339_1198 [Aciduliprofundum sp. MAR08-339]
MEIDDKTLHHYFEITRKAYEKVRISVPENSHLYPIARDFLGMARAYIEDAEYFRKKGDYVRALGAIYYAHGWLDAGARLGIFDVEDDHTLFTLAR